jgi:DNA modification methylase
MSKIGYNSARQPGWHRLATVDIPIADLAPFPNHARRHSATQIRALARSIDALNYNVPIIIDEQNRILAGHACVEAVKRLGCDTIPAVRISDLTEAQKRAFVLAHNRLAESATWDEALLAENLQILDALDLDFTLEVTGFETTEIDRLLGFEIIGETVAEEALPEPCAGPPISRLGDLWHLGSHRLYCGDALEVQAHRMLMGQDRARMMLSDPPYNLAARDIGRIAVAQHGDFVAAHGELDDAGFVRFLETAFMRARASCLDGALAYIFMDWRHAWHALDAGRRVFDELKHMCIWSKTNAGMGSLYRSQHELVLVFKAGCAPHVNNVELGRNGRNRSNVWTYAGANSLRGAVEDATRAETLALHPTIKPVALLADAILDVTRRGEIVLDPFMGSGSTMIAAERVGRGCRGIERDPRYVDAALRRWSKYTGEPAIHAESGLDLEALAELRRAEMEASP